MGKCRPHSAPSTLGPALEKVFNVSSHQEMPRKATVRSYYSTEWPKFRRLTLLSVAMDVLGL